MDLIIGLLSIHSFINMLDKANKNSNRENKKPVLYKQALLTVNNDKYISNTIYLESQSALAK